MPADIDLLREIPLFVTMDDEERTAIAAIMEEAHIEEDTVIFHENDQGGVLWIINRGKVELSVVDEEDEKVIVDILEEGEFFGEMSLLDGGTRSTTAIALTDVHAFTLERDDFLDLLRHRSDTAFDVVSALARRIRKTDYLLRRSVRNPNDVVEERETLGDRVADVVARFGGSWKFIIAFGVFMSIWIMLNTIFVLVRRADGQPFDPYPFILLNLMLSMLAALQAPFIMMSQNRQDAKDRIRSELDYQVNRKAELEILQLHEKVDQMNKALQLRMDRQWKLINVRLHR